MTKALRGAPAVVAAFLAFQGPGAPPPPSPAEGETLEELRATHERLHEELQALVDRDPVVRRVFTDRGQVVVAVQSRWIETVIADLATRYLENVTVDLRAVEASAGGTIRTDTLVGRIALGDWQVDVRVSSLVGSLSSDRPSLTFRAPDLLHVELPVRIRPSPGQVALHLHWDSAALTSVVCRDFELTRDLRGNVLAQTHTLQGDIAFRSEDGAIVATPLFPDRKIRLKVDLSAESWASVESALRSQDSFGRCGALMKPERILAKLHDLAQEGIGVTLPASMFNPVRLPTRVEKRVAVQDRSVDVGVTALTLTFGPQMLWSSASIKAARAASDQAKATP